jgi:hypothetical protein
MVGPTSSDMYDKVDSIAYSSAFKLLIETQFACAPPGWHEYRVMFWNLRENITVMRQDWSPPSPSSGGSCADPLKSSHFGPLSPTPSYESYRTPFNKFPIIQSHVHPFCVIYNAGQKLQHKPYLIPPSHIDRADLQMVKRLYDQFTAPPPPTWGHDIPIEPSEPPGDDERGSRKRSRHPDDLGPSTRQRRDFVETSRVFTQTAHTTGKAGRADEYGEQLPKGLHFVDPSELM